MVFSFFHIITITVKFKTKVEKQTGKANTMKLNSFPVFIMSVSPNIISIVPKIRNIVLFIFDVERTENSRMC